MLKKIISIALISLFSNQSFAFLKKDDTYYVNKCADRGIEKVLSLGHSFQCLSLEDISEDSDLIEDIYPSDIDNRAWNPSTYIWYTLDVQCNGRKTIQVMVQHYGGKCI